MSRKGTRKGSKTRKMRGGKKWTTALSAANKTLKKTGSLDKAKKTLNTQALSNARKLFGSV